MGGTNIYAPLKHIFSGQINTGYSKIIFLLTDGCVSDKESVIKLIKKNSSNFKVNSFGIGNDFDKDLIVRSAQAGKGISNFVKKTNEIAKKVISTLSKCLVPTLSCWELLCNGENHPKVFGNLNYGDRFLIYSKFEEIPKSSVSIKVFDNFIKDYKEILVSDFVETSMNVYKLWAEYKLADLSSGENNSQEVIRFSIESGIPTTLTALYCEKQNNEVVLSELKFVEVVKEKIYEEKVLGC